MQLPAALQPVADPVMSAPCTAVQGYFECAVRILHAIEDTVGHLRNLELLLSQSRMALTSL
jgi:hypothetical protein